MTAHTHNNRIRAVDLRQGGFNPRMDRDRFGIAVTAEHLALHRGFVAHAAFDHSSIESARITSSADRREAAIPDALRDDRRFDEPRRGR